MAGEGESENLGIKKYEILKKMQNLADLEKERLHNETIEAYKKRKQYADELAKLKSVEKKRLNEEKCESDRKKKEFLDKIVTLEERLNREKDEERKKKEKEDGIDSLKEEFIAKMKEEERDRNVRNEEKEKELERYTQNWYTYLDKSREEKWIKEQEEAIEFYGQYYMVTNMELKMEAQEARERIRNKQAKAEKQIDAMWDDARERIERLEYEAKEEIARKWSKAYSKVNKWINECDIYKLAEKQAARTTKQKELDMLTKLKRMKENAEKMIEQMGIEANNKMLDMTDLILESVDEQVVKKWAYLEDERLKIDEEQQQLNDFKMRLNDEIDLKKKEANDTLTRLNDEAVKAEQRKNEAEDEIRRLNAALNVIILSDDLDEKKNEYLLTAEGTTECNQEEKREEETIKIDDGKTIKIKTKNPFKWITNKIAKRSEAAAAAVDVKSKEIKEEKRKLKVEKENEMKQLKQKATIAAAELKRKKQEDKKRAEPTAAAKEEKKTKKKWLFFG